MLPNKEDVRRVGSGLNPIPPRTCMVHPGARPSVLSFGVAPPVPGVRLGTAPLPEDVEAAPPPPEPLGPSGVSPPLFSMLQIGGGVIGLES